MVLGLCLILLHMHIFHLLGCNCKWYHKGLNGVSSMTIFRDNYRLWDLSMILTKILAVPFFLSEIYWIKLNESMLASQEESFHAKDCSSYCLKLA